VAWRRWDSPAEYSLERLAQHSQEHSPEHLPEYSPEHLPEQRSDCRRHLFLKPARASPPGSLWLAAPNEPLRRSSAGASASQFHPGSRPHRSSRTWTAHIRRDWSRRHFWTVEDWKQAMSSIPLPYSWLANYSPMKSRSVTSRRPRNRHWTTIEPGSSPCRQTVEPPPRVSISLASPIAPRCRIPARCPQR
jgi:hypothetical protein